MGPMLPFPCQFQPPLRYSNLRVLQATFESFAKGSAQEEKGGRKLQKNQHMEVRIPKKDRSSPLFYECNLL